MSYSAQNPIVESASANGSTPSVARNWGLTLNLVTGVSQQIDLTAYQNISLVKNIQGIYIDNTANQSACSVSCGTNAGQTVTCPGMAALYAPIPVPPGNPVFTVSGNGTVKISFSNYQQPAAVIPSNGTIGNVTTVTDVALDALVLNGAFSASEALYGNGDIIQHARAGIPFFGTLAPNGTLVVVGWSGNVFLNSYKLSLTPDFTMSAGNTIDVILRFLNLGTVDVGRIVVGTSAVGGVVPLNIIQNNNVQMIGEIGGGGETLEIVTQSVGTLSGSITAGAIRYAVTGGTTSLS